jgi:hypothetical protein
MKHIFYMLLPVILIAGCKKNTQTEFPDRQPEPPILTANCDMQPIYANNETKPTIGRGVWGTVTFTEGNCMPVFLPNQTSCRTCPVRRTVRIYEYTTRSQAYPLAGNPAFYPEFNTRLIKEINTDADGFYEAELPAGIYTIVVKEGSYLYASMGDGFGGINPVTITSGRTKSNFPITYKAFF